jgi:transposase
VSSIVALVAPSRRHRARLYARHFEGTIHGKEAAAGLRYFRKKVGRRLIVVWDRLGVHGSREVKAMVRAHPKDYALEKLPSYAPDLNPEEGCNSQAKAELKNALPVDIPDLHRKTRQAFIHVGESPAALRGYFRHAGLSLRGLS